MLGGIAPPLNAGVRAQMPYFARLYTSPAGRTGRLAYNLFFVVPSFVLGIVAGFFSPASPGSAQLLLLALIVVTLWPSAVVNIKRLHDIGFTGWLLAVWWVVVLAPILLRVAHGVMYAQLVSLACVLLLMTIPGTNGPNRYGAKP